MKLIWLSDLHLEFIGEFQLRAFIQEILNEKPDAVLITGDVSNAHRLEYHLGLLAQLLPCPIYFVLGNHDFYLGSFDEINSLARDLCARHPNLIELDQGEIISLGTDTVLIGHRGWADGRAGMGSRSTVRLNDHQYITDLREPFTPRLFSALNRLGDESADYISKIAPEALKRGQTLIIATHVPPFSEASLYENRPSDPAHAPHFVNVAIGRAILGVAQAHPQKSIRVLCGHTHHQSVCSPTSNLRVEVAGAEYYNPKVASVLTIP